MADTEAGRPSGGARGDKGADAAAKLASYLMTRAPAEDVACYEPGALEAAAQLAWEAVSRHRKGDSVIAIDTSRSILRQGRPVSVITVVNDNMPFLFDSILSEISESAGEASLVVHPVLSVLHDENGVTELVGESAATKHDGAADRVSLVHVHVAPLSDSEAEGLAERLRKILVQVRAAVTDWKPMRR